MNNNRPYTFSRKKKRLLISYTCPDFRDCYGINIDYISAGRSRKNTEDRGQKTAGSNQRSEIRCQRTEDGRQSLYFGFGNADFGLERS